MTLTCSREHLNLRECTMNIPRYLISFTHEMTVPDDNDTGRHEALFLVPIRKQHDLRVLTTISSLSSSNSHILTKASRPQTEGAISRMSSAYRITQTPGTERHIVVKSSK